MLVATDRSPAHAGDEMRPIASARNARGVDAELRRKSVAKYWLEAKPQAKAMSVTLRSGCSFSSRAAAANRQWFRYWMGVMLVSCLRVVDEVRHAHAASPGHAADRPLQRQMVQILAQVGPKQLDRAAGAGERLVELDLLAAEHLQDRQEQLVDVDGQAGDAAAVAIGLDGRADAAEALGDFRRGMPHRLLVVTQNVGQLSQIVGASARSTKAIATSGAAGGRRRPGSGSAAARRRRADRPRGAAARAG